jgi:O-antigen/teichoic acid export membrane protein
VPGTSTAQLEAFFYFGYGLVVFNAMQAVLTGQLMAIGLLWVSTVVDVASRLFYGVVLVVGFALGAGLWALIVASFAQGIAYSLVIFIIAWRRYAFPFGNPFALERSMFRELVRFGGWAQVSSLLNTLTYSTDGIVIGTFVSTAATGVANIASRLARQIPYFATVPEATLPAMAAAQQAGEGPEGLARMSIRSNRISYLLGTSIATMVFGCAPVLLALWIGRWYADADIATCLSAATVLVAILGQTAGIGIYALGRVGYGARARVAGFIVNLVVTVALVKPLGMPGVLIGTLLATIATNAYLQVRVDQLLGISQWRSVFSWLLPLLAAALPPIILDRLTIAFMPASVAHHRGPALVAFAVLTVINYVAFVVAVRLSGFLTGEDVRYLRRSLPGPMRKLASPRLLSLLVRSSAMAAAQ